MAELSALGFGNPSDLAKSVEEGKPLDEAIKEFREENGIQLPSLYPGLHLLDLLGVRRGVFYNNVLTDFTSKILKRIDDCSSDDSESSARIASLLEHSFRYHRVPQLRPVVLALLARADSVSKSIRKQILADKDLFADVSLSVKRQIWESVDDPGFAEYVAGLVNKYVDEVRCDYRSLGQSSSADVLLPSLFCPVKSRHRRQNSTALAAIFEVIGESSKLYDMVVSQIRTDFTFESPDTSQDGGSHAKKAALCLLRCDLVLKAHERNSVLFSHDPVHKFALLLDGCVRDHSVDPKRAKELLAELQTVVASKRTLKNRTLLDFSMIAACPYIFRALGSMLVSSLPEAANTASASGLRDSGAVAILLHTLRLALDVDDIASTAVQRQYDCRLEETGAIVAQQLAVITQLWYQSQMRHSVLHSASGLVESFDVDGLVDEEDVNDLSKSVAEDNLVAVVLWFLTAECVGSRADSVIIHRFLPLYLNSAVVPRWGLVPILVSSLANSVHLFSDDGFCRSVFDDFLLPLLNNMNDSIARRQCLLLLSRVFGYVSFVDKYLDALQPDSEKTEADYADLHEAVRLKAASNAFSGFCGSPVKIASTHSILENIL